MGEISEFKFEERETLFVEVVLPLSLAKNYIYRIPFDLNDQIEVGKRVIVQFGKNKIYTALIKSISTTAPEIYEAKYIIDVVDRYPVVNPLQLKFWDWMMDYYVCNEGDVMSAALPTGLKLTSETIIVFREDAELDVEMLSEKEYAIVTALSTQHRLSVDDIMKLLGQKTVFPIIKSLIDKEIVYIAEEVVEKYKPLLKSFITLNDFYKEEENLKELFGILDRAPKQMDALLAYISLSKNRPDISKQEL
ncbi:MAG TPA: hypothetical protein VNZ46_24525, partial [Pedobacter sp.]|nr:hypothetical protein [Pedobacter sp.]